MVLFAALTAAIFDWPRLLTFVGLVPGVVLLIRVSWHGGRARGLTTRTRPSPGWLALCAGVSALSALFAGTLPERYFGVVVVGAGVIGEVAWRARWARIDRRRTPGAHSLSIRG
jgi:hypothetical protein